VVSVCTCEGLKCTCDVRGCVRVNLRYTDVGVCEEMIVAVAKCV